MTTSAANQYHAGSPAYTTTTGFTQPAVNSNVQATFGVALWMVAGQVIYIATGGYYQVVSVDSGVLATIKNLGYTGNLAPSQAVPNGSGVSPGGLVGPTGAAGSSTGVGAYASRPAAGTAGAQYFSTDGTRQFVDDGTNWRPNINGCLGTQPATVSNWTWVNQSTATATDVGGAIHLASASNNVDSWRMLVRSLSPANSYTLLAHIRPLLYAANYATASIVLRESSSGKLVTFGLVRNTAGTPDLQVTKWTNATTWVASYIDLTLTPMISDGVWLRVVDDGANRVCSWSFDGKNFMQAHTVGRTDFCTPDQYGVGVNPLNGAAGLTLDSISQA